jgi:hypothetical protein
VIKIRTLLTYGEEMCAVATRHRIFLRGNGQILRYIIEKNTLDSSTVDSICVPLINKGSAGAATAYSRTVFILSINRYSIG